MFEAPSTNDKIALRPFKVGERQYQPADRTDIERIRARGDMDERTIQILGNQNFYVPLTRHNYEIAVARRPAEAGRIGRGFTAAYLLAAGIIDVAPEETQATMKIAPTTDAIAYKGMTIQPVRNGKFTLYEAVAPNGDLLRATRFRKQADAEKFIDDVVAAAAPREAAVDKNLDPPATSTESAPSVTSQAEAENPDGGDVQSRADGSDLSGASGAG